MSFLKRHSSRRLQAAGLILIALTLPAAAPLAAQQQADPYADARRAFGEGRYTLAAEILDNALRTGGLGQHRASAWLLLAASWLGADAPEPALQALEGLSREYPEGPYLLERDWLTGRAHARAGRFYEAASRYALVAAAEPDSRLARAARDEVAEIVGYNLSTAELERLGVDLAGTDLKAWIAVLAAAELADRGDLQRARRVLERVVAESPVGDYRADIADQLETLRERITSEGPGGLVIGVLAPLSGPDAEAGAEILNAARLAVGMSEAEIELRVRDTGGSLSGTVEGTLALINEDGAGILIGPWQEELAYITAGLAELADIPIILPHSRGSAAPRLGENVFQLQATPTIQARAMADAAMDSLGMHTFAVLAPFSGPERDFAEIFLARVEEKGGSVIAYQEYFPGAADWQVQLNEIRFRGLAMSLADTAGIAIDDRNALAEANEDTLENLVPVGSIDGLLVPGLSVNDCVYIATQVKFFNLVTTILGGSAWNSYSVINQGGAYVNGAIFTDTWSIAHTSMPQIDFANAYHTLYGSQPERAATMTWDAVRLAMTAWRMVEGGTEDRGTVLRRWLAGVSAYEGASGPINLERNARTNNTVYFLTIAGRRIEPFRFISAADVPPPGR